MQERDFLIAGFSGVAFSSPEKNRNTKTQISFVELFLFIAYLTKYP